MHVEACTILYCQFTRLLTTSASKGDPALRVLHARAAALNSKTYLSLRGLKFGSLSYLSDCTKSGTKTPAQTTEVSLPAAGDKQILPDRKKLREGCSTFSMPVSSKNAGRTAVGQSSAKQQRAFTMTLRHAARSMHQNK